MTAKQDIRQAITIAALLHDIGKLGQRAAQSRNELPASILKMQDRVCRKKDTYFTHLHSLWTLDFFEKYKNSFPLPVTGYSFSDNATDTIANMAAFHHADNLTPLQEIIKQADWLSAGMDRIENADVEDEQDKKIRFRNQKLRSIFSLVDLKDTEKRKDYFYHLAAFSTDETCFPFQDDNSEELTHEYQSLYQNFCDKFTTLGESHFVDRLVALLEEYTLYVPSATQDLADISLYDHSCTTAALAIALYDYHHAHNTLTVSEIENWEKEKFLLVSGDVSGIQNYIFRLNTENVRGASKILRARSFYIQMVTHVVAHHILAVFNLPGISRIIDAGGRFILLLPNTKNVVEKLAQIKGQLDTWFFNRFSGELAVNLNWNTAISGNDLKQENFREVLSRLGSNTEIEKKRKFFAHFKQNNWQPECFVLEEPYQGFRKHEKCQSCGKYPGSVTDADSEEPRKICPFCALDQKVGKWLINTEFFAISKEAGLAEKSFSLFDLYHVYLFSADEPFQPELFDSVFITSDRKTGQIYPRHLIANYIPFFSGDEKHLYSAIREDDEPERLPGKNIPKTFHHLAKLGTVDRKTGEEVGGKAMIAVLKADVDSLGQIFSRGLGEKVSISRYATLSRLLDHFFVGHLMHVLHNSKGKTEDFSDIYTVYAGGDDLLFIGEWKLMIQFSMHLQEAFKRYVCSNPDISLSAGIATIPPRYPINRGIEQADDLLDRAKNKGRNRIGLFETILTWPELQEAMAYGRFFDQQIQDKDSKINNSFLYRLLTYHKQFLNFHEKNEVKELIYLSHLKYDIARNKIVEFDKKGEVKPEYVEIYNKLLPLMATAGESMRIMKNLKVPVFYAMYKNRGTQEKSEVKNG